MAEVEAHTGTELQAYAESKWGFLKNIININTFFAGPDDVSGGKAAEENGPSETFN